MKDFCWHRLIAFTPIVERRKKSGKTCESTISTMLFCDSYFRDYERVHNSGNHYNTVAAISLMQTSIGIRCCRFPKGSRCEFH